MNPSTDMKSRATPEKLRAAATAAAARRRMGGLLLLFGGSQMQSLVDGVEGQLQTVGDAQFVEDVVQMVLDRLLGNEHLFGHLFVLVALGHESHDLAFAGAQRSAFAGFADRVRDF